MSEFLLFFCLSRFILSTLTPLGLLLLSMIYLRFRFFYFVFNSITQHSFISHGHYNILTNSWVIHSRYNTTNSSCQKIRLNHPKNIWHHYTTRKCAFKYRFVGTRLIPYIDKKPQKIMFIYHYIISLISDRVDCNDNYIVCYMKNIVQMAKFSTWNSYLSFIQMFHYFKQLSIHYYI